MPTNRTPIRRSRKGGFTPEVIGLYRHLREIYCSGDQDLWEKSKDQRLRLQQLLGRTAPWLIDIFTTIDDEECVYPPTAAGGRDWPVALALRKALDAEIGET